jgi:hypothetical protein
MLEPQMGYRGLVTCFVAVVVALVVGTVPSLLGRSGTVAVIFIAVIAAFGGAIRHYLDYRDYLRRWRQGE